MNGTSKISLEQLSRKAVIYIRQSTTRQVQANEESTRRQYGLRDVLLNLGWPPELIETTDSDLGISGKYSENREGFQKLVGDVANGYVGAVACMEASRLSRSNSDWARIIDFCALTKTVIIDEDGVYDPVDPNDRLLLGVKGSIAEMELHYIRARMHGGLINKVKRGELKIKLPVGYAFDPLDRIIFDPDLNVQEAIKKLFTTFDMQGSVYRTVVYFKEHGLMFPVKYNTGERKGEIDWQPITNTRALHVLKNPIYCGRYVYGKSKVIQTPVKRNVVTLPESEWTVNIHDHHPAYITEDEYARNQLTLAQNSLKSGPDDLPETPGKGNALLQGIVYCGKCGKKMKVAYQMSSSSKRSLAYPLYICDGNPDAPHHRCTQVNGMAIDEKISDLICEKLSDEALRNSIEIKEEVDSKWSENERLLQLNLKRAEYESNAMKKRYMNCDPENALVRIEIEKAYNDALAHVVEAEKKLREETARHSKETQEEMERKLDNLVNDFRKVWEAPETDMISKKKLLRYLIRSVTLTRNDNERICKVQILYSGNETDEFTIHCNFYGSAPTSWKVFDFLEKYGSEYPARLLAVTLNRDGYFRADGKEWTTDYLCKFMADHKIKTMKQNYLDKGYITVTNAAKSIGISHQSMTKRIKSGYYDGKYIWVSDSVILMDPSVIKKDYEKDGASSMTRND